MRALLPICVALALLPLVAPPEARAADCQRTDRFGLSNIAAEVLARIETSGPAQADSPVDVSRIFSTCNRFLDVAVDGTEIFEAARDLIAKAEHEVDMVFFGWEAGSQGARLIGDGLIAAQEGRRRGPPLLVRILVDDVVVTSVSRAVNELYDSQKLWVERGLDPRRVEIQLATAPRATQASPNLHDKIIVVDGRYALVTGANVQKHNDPGPTQWHDSAYLFEGDVALSALEAFEHSWDDDDTNYWRCREQAFSRDCDKRAPFPPPRRHWLPSFGSQRPGDVPILAVGRVKKGILNNDTDNPQDIAWLTLMDLATSHIHVESPNINDDAFKAAIHEAIDDGVTVRLISSLGFNEARIDLPVLGDSNLEVVGNLRKEIRAKYPDDLGRQQLLQVRWHSVDGLEPEGGNDGQPSHTKYMTADDAVAVVGSGNMDTPSWNIAHEFNVLVDDPGVTRQVEDELFLPDWQRAIGGYAELYEGNDGSQDIICIVATGNEKSVRFWDFGFGFPYLHDTWRCDNDEARSVLLHDVEAGSVLRFYDDPDRRYHDDDWTEIVVKRPVARRYVETFERSFEDDDVQVTYHRDDGLDGKISAAEVSDTPIGAVIDLYEGNHATQDLVCSNRIGGSRTLAFKQDPHCENDEARSMVLSNFPEDQVVFVYDSPDGSRSDDWAVIVPRRPISHATVGTFEHSDRTDDYEICAFPDNGLDGKVSRMRIGPRSEAVGLCGDEDGGDPLSAGKTYTLSPAPASQYPDLGGELTDGITETGESWVNAAGWLYVDPTITLDLGAVHDLSEVELYVGNSFGDGSFGVFRPERAAVSVSNDGVIFTPVGDLSFRELSAIGTKEQVDLGSAPLATTGRYVRVDITAGGPWVMVTEIVVKGPGGGSCTDVGEPCDGSDADLCQEGTILADCSCSDTTGSIAEVCNGVDDDCDGVIDEGVCEVPVSANDSYTLSPAPDSQYPDSGGVELTDGITATGESWTNAAGWLYVDPTIVLDLDAVHALGAVELYVGNSFGDGSFGVDRPERVAVSVSNDGTTFTRAADLSFREFSAIGTKEQVDLGTALLGVSGRYVRLDIQAGGAWVMVTEVRVYGE